MAETGASEQNGLHITVAGSGLAAWMAAMALARVLGPAAGRVKVIATGDGEDLLAPFGAADSSLPTGGPLHPAIEIDERQWLQSAGASFTLGIALSGWNGAGSAWFHPFSAIGASLGPVPFHHAVLKLRRSGADLRLSNFALAALAAQAGRFARPDPDPASVESTCRYGLQVDGSRLAALYRAEAEGLGVEVFAGHLERVEIAADGSVAALHTRDGSRHGADLFVDCTGAEARVANAMPASKWLGWADSLPCDRAISARITTKVAPLPYTQADAHKGGWLRSVRLADSLALTHLHDSRVVPEDVAVRALRESAGRRLQDLHAHYLRLGRRERIWHRNCVALGPAAALIDPVGVSNLQLLRLGLHYLLQLLPGAPIVHGANEANEAHTEAGEYNRRFGACLDNARDFAAAHYRLNGRSGEAFWDACRAAPLPAALDYRLRLYASRGRIALYDEEPLDEASWINLFDEQGIRPHSYTPIADGLSDAQIDAHAQRVRGIMLAAVGRMPGHGEYLARLKAG